MQNSHAITKGVICAAELVFFNCY